jgi:hypothetical protein
MDLDPAGSQNGDPRRLGPEPAKSRVRRIAEEEFIVILLLAAFGVILLLIFPPFMLVNDSWMSLVSGREIVQHGLPHHDTLTVYGIGRTWTDQQWAAQLVFYGVHSVGGFPLLAVLDCAMVFSAFAIAIAGARALGAGPRAIWVLFLPVLIAAPWAWSIRAQLFALPLYTGLLWLLATEARRPTRRVYLAFPLLLVWANLHGSVALGALLTTLLAVVGLVTGRGRTLVRTVLLLVVPPLCVLATPYGPVATWRYYDLLLVNPPFDHDVTEWMWTKPEWRTLVFYLLGVAAVPLVIWGRKRLTLFDIAVLALTFAGGVEAIRGTPWFALASMVFLPVAIGSRAPDVYSDWLLWKIPELRGRLAYDVRFEIYPTPFFHRLLRYNGEYGKTWKDFADGYPMVVVDETERSHTADFLKEPGAREIYHDKNVTVIVRPAPK